MSMIKHLWAGKVYGTNTGNVFFNFEVNDDNSCVGKIRFNDDKAVIGVFEITGKFENNVLEVKGDLILPKIDEKLILTVKGEIDVNGQLKGEWEDTLGAGGTFLAFRHFAATNNNPVITSAIQEQLHLSYKELGALTLYADDIIDLVSEVRKDFNLGRAIINSKHKGSIEKIQYADVFLSEIQDKNETYEYLRVHIEEVKEHGLKNIVTVDIRAYGLNEIVVQGAQESWVSGKAENVAGFLKLRQSTLATTYKKFGLNLNQIIFFAMLIVMPSLATNWDRLYFGLIVLLLLNFLAWMHKNFIPNATIKTAKAKQSFWGRYWPSILSWAGTFISAVIAALILKYLEIKD